MSQNEKLLVAVLVAAAAVLGGGTLAIKALPRGVRNNNPGNIRRTQISWKGELPDSKRTDDEFEQFVGAEWGFRALAREIMTSIGRGQTLSQLIHEHAPPSENPTSDYVVAVAERTRLNPDEKVPSTAIMPLMDAITIQEQGFNPWPQQLLEQGYRLAQVRS